MRLTGQTAEEELLARKKGEKWADEFIYCRQPVSQPVDQDGMVRVNLIRSQGQSRILLGACWEGPYRQYNGTSRQV